MFPGDENGVARAAAGAARRDGWRELRADLLQEEFRRAAKGTEGPVLVRLRLPGVHGEVEHFRQRHQVKG